MSENAVKLFAAFRAETPDYDPNHIEVYIQRLADNIDDLRIERDTVGTEKSALRGEFSILEADVRGLRGEVERLTAELKAANDRADAAEADAERLFNWANDYDNHNWRCKYNRLDKGLPCNCGLENDLQAHRDRVGFPLGSAPEPRE